MRKEEKQETGNQHVATTADDDRWVQKRGSKSVFSSHNGVKCGETVKAVHTHTRRGSDGVRTGDERLSVVQADENIHGAAE